MGDTPLEKLHPPTARQKVRRRERTAVFRLLQYCKATPIQRHPTNEIKSCRKFVITHGLSNIAFDFWLAGSA